MENQLAADTMDRIRASQYWLAQQIYRLPGPDAANHGLTSMLRDLNAFWDTPETQADGLPRRQAFARELRRLACDDAALRANDGTLSKEAYDLVRTLATTPHASRPDHVRPSQLVLSLASTGDSSLRSRTYAGALVLRDRSRKHLALLFTTHGGWQAFPSLDALYAHVQAALDDHDAGGHAVPGLLPNDVVERTFRIDRIAGDPFVDLAEQLIVHQRARVEDAWRRPEAIDPTPSPDHLAYAMGLFALVDPQSMMQHRDVALLAKVREERLAAYPAALRDEWNQAFARQARAIRDVDPDTIGTIDAPRSLREFAEDELGTRLRRMGIATPPQDIAIAILDRPLSPTQLVSTYLYGFRSTTTSLLQLAYLNLGRSEIPGASIAYPKDATVPALTSDALRDLVRTVDLNERYRRHLDQVAGDTATGRINRERSEHLYLAHLRMDVADLALERHDLGAERPVKPHWLDEASFEWIKAIVGTSSSPTLRSRLRIHQLAYGGAPVTDALAVSREGDDRIVLYTPDGHGDQNFRQFANADAMVSDYLLHTGETYVVDRLPVRFSTIDDHGHHHFAIAPSTRLARWVFNGPTGVGLTSEHTFSLRDVTDDYARTVFDARIQKARWDTETTTRSTATADREAVSITFDALTQAMHLPSKVVIYLGKTTVLSLGQVAPAAWRAYDGVKERDYTKAFLAWTHGYVEALNVLPLYASVPKMLGGHLIRSGMGRGALIDSGRSIARRHTILDERYIARDIGAPHPAATKDGILRVGDRTYIHQAGRAYEVHYDTQASGWRLKGNGVVDMNGNHAGPLVARRADGTWRPVDDVRQWGLFNETPAVTARHYLRWMRMRGQMAMPVSDLTFREFTLLNGELGRRLGRPAATRVVDRLGRNTTLGTAEVSAIEREHWHEVLADIQSRRAPASP